MTKKDALESGKQNSTFNLFIPFKVISKQRMSFFLWTAFSLIGGAIGIIVNCVRHWLFEGMPFKDALTIEGKNGSFYTYSIALIAAVLSSVFVNFVENKEVKFRKFKIPVITVAIYLLFFGGVMYTLFMSFIGTEQEIRNSIMGWGQVVIVFCAVVLSIYSFCVCRMDNEIFKDTFKDVEDQYFDNSNEDVEMGLKSMDSNNG